MDSKTALAEFGNFTVTAPIPLAGRAEALPYVILKDMGARLSKRLILQQICDVAPESRIYLSGECFIDRADLLVVIRTSKTPSSIFSFSALIRAVLALST